VRTFIISTALLSYLSLSCPQQVYGAEIYDEQFIAAQLERARTDPDHRISIEVNQPIEVVFDVLLNRLADYSDDVASIRFTDADPAMQSSPGIGTERITTLENGKQLIQRLLVFDAPHRFAYFTDMNKSTASVPIRYSIGHYQLDDLGNGKTRAQISVAYAPSSRLTAPFVRLAFQRALERDFANAERFLNNQNTP